MNNTHLKLFFIIVLVTVIAACSLISSRTGAAIDAASYNQALSECVDQGKAAKSYDIYEECAKRADAKFNVKEAGVK